MAHWGISRLTTRPALAVALRYGLAVASVATALGTTLILRHYGSPPRFISHFTLIAIAVTFWCAGPGPGLLALFLSSLGVSLLARNDFLLTGFPLESVLIFFAVFSLLTSWFSASRRRAEQLLTQARDNLELQVVASPTRVTVQNRRKRVKNERICPRDTSENMSNVGATNASLLAGLSYARISDDCLQYFS
jgi:hypothetical protein